MRKLIFLLTIMIWTYASYGQSFEHDANTPYNIEVVNLQDESNLAFKYLFYDNDNDGDYDLTLMGMGEPDTTTQNLLFSLRYFIEYQENIGTPTTPSFSPREQHYGSFQFPTGEGFMIPDGGDLNNDGLIDFVVSAETDLYGTQYLQFQIQNSDGSFTVTNCTDWNLDPFLAYSFFIPELTDLDMDGDLDILLGGYHRSYDENLEEIEIPAYLYAKNIGTPEHPEFLGWFENPYGLKAEGQSFFTSGDLDMDGDMDLLNLAIENDVSVLSFVENIGNDKPEFATPVNSPFGLPTTTEEEGFLFPAVVDIDHDGDLDLFLPVSGEENFDLRFYRNNECLNMNPGLIVNGTLITAVEQSDFSYSWYDCNTSEIISTGNEHTFSAPYSGSFAVSILDGKGCIHESDCISVMVSSVYNVGLDASIVLHPIPTEGAVYISNNSNEKIKAMQLYNERGQLLNPMFRVEDGYVDISEFESGIFMLRLDFGKTQVVKKIILMK